MFGCKQAIYLMTFIVVEDDSLFLSHEGKWAKMCNASAMAMIVLVSTIHDYDDDDDDRDLVPMDSASKNIVVLYMILIDP